MTRAATAIEAGKPCEASLIALNNLATMYAECEGVERDSCKAARLYENAAQKGNFDALNNLGTM